MINRRSLLVTGMAVAAALGASAVGRVSGHLDDVAKALGIDPLRVSSPADEKVRVQAVRDQALLLASLSATQRAHASTASALAPMVEHAQTHLVLLGKVAPDDAVRAPPTAATVSEAIADLIAQTAMAEVDRTNDAVAAVSSEFAQLLASIAASLSQRQISLKTLAIDP